MATAIRVRMYRIGFGDCFLASFPDGDGHQHVLVDCGVHQQGDIQTLQKIVQQVALDCGNELAAVVATHEHQDHLSGYATHADAFRQLTIAEVWMPWTSDPDDPVARKLRNKHLAVLRSLQAHFRVATAPDDVKAILQNLAPNRTALDLLRGGIDGKAKVRYLRADAILKQAAGIAGLTVRVLAPPTDVSGLGRMDPPAKERFLHAADGAAAGTRNRNGDLQPFPRHLQDRRPAARLTQKERALLHDQLLMESLAFSLDSAVNNTSLVLAMTFAGHTLLFPGDAQWGNWASWLGTQEATDLLGSIEFLKVAHHGSHNASPKSAITAMTNSGLAAMASTQSRPWKSIPQGKLLTAIGKQSKNRLVRSDSLVVQGAPKGPALAQPLPKGFTKGPFWMDYSIPI